MLIDVAIFSITRPHLPGRDCISGLEAEYCQNRQDSPKLTGDAPAPFPDHQQVKSELGVKVAAALRESRIQIALPREEMYVRSIDASVSREARALGASGPHGSLMLDQQRQEKEHTQEK